MEVPVDLQDELEVEVLPVGRVVDEVGVDPLPGLVVWVQTGMTQQLTIDQLRDYCLFPIIV
jgi:hypothetical protein